MSVTKSDTTNNEGKFNITGLPNGEYNVTLTKIGYFYEGKIITIADGDVTGDQIIIEPTSEGHKVTISVKENNIGISGVIINMANKTKTTDNEGKCTFEDVIDGTYTAKANKTGYQEKQETIVVSGADVDRTMEITKVFRVSGVVKHGASQEILAGATVKLGDETVTTAADGSYSFSNVLEGAYDFTISKDYYITYTEAGLGVHADVTKDIVLTDNYAVVGVVKYGETLTEGVNVKVEQGATEIGTATTDENGAYSISGCTTGDYKVSISKAGFEDQSIDITITSESTTCNFGITKPSLTLTVKDNAGSPLEGVAVSFGSYSGTTNESGICFIDDIEPNTYTVEASLAHYVTSTKSITISSVDVTDEMTIAANFKIYGVVSHNGTAIENASVSVDSGSSVLTGSDGSYTVEGLNKGTHTIRVSKTGYKDIFEQFTITNDDVRKDVSLTQFDVKFTIVDENSSALANAMIELNGETKTTDSSGVCTFTDVANGSYTASLSKSHYTSKTVDVIVNNADVTVNNSLLLIYIITGTVTDADGNALAGASVTVADPVLSATTGSDGKYEISSSDIVSGSMLSMSASKSGYATKSDTLNVTSSDLTKDFTLTGFNVNVTVKDSVSTSAVEGATVTLE